jgi:DNA-binding CsgD family transcriptional regulator
VPYPREATLDRLASRFHEHPLCGLIARTPRRGHQAARWSDKTTLRQFRQTGLYHDYYRHMGTRHQLGLAVHMSPRGAVSLTFNRSRTDFQREDADVLHLFARHVRQSIQRLKGQREVEGVLALRDLAVRREAVAIVDDSGVLRFATEPARQLMRDYFSGTAELPDTLRIWLAGRPTAGRYLTQPTSGGTLWIRCVAEAPAYPASQQGLLQPAEQATGSLRLLHFHDHAGSQASFKLQELGLTKREAEILQWMLQGKRNAEIGIILGISHRTVDKHRENMFAKLQVESRTAAIAMAWEALR